jgi:hypothetical protein
VGTRLLETCIFSASRNMGSRGPRSSAELGRLTVIEVRRPKPPAELTEAEAAIWRDVVGCMPGDWFPRSTHPILANYCRHVARAAMLAEQINRFEPEWLAAEGGPQRLNLLLAMAERETRAITACARALRLTPQSQIRPTRAGTAARGPGDGPRPWDDPTRKEKSHAVSRIEADGD